MLRGLSRGAKVAIVSPCGFGNLGDAAILDSVIHGLRARVPGVRIVAFTLNPEDTAARHGLEAYTCAAYPLPFYPVREPTAAGAAEAAADAQPPPPSRLKALLQRLPIHGSARAALLAPLRLRHEPAHLRASRERLAGAEMLIFAGGGQLDAAWGGFLGHPWVLLRWARLARAAGAQVAFASVGTGTLTPVSRALVRRALRLAGYRSFRDARSRELVGGPALGDPVVPDLAFGAPVAAQPAPGAGRLSIAISPINYAHPRHWPRRDPALYAAQVAAFGGLASRAVEAGHRVTFFTTDNDGAAVEDSLAAAGESRGAIRLAPAGSLADLYATLAGADLVVSARLHGALLALVCGRPVLAVSHERKVRTLMQDLGQADACVEIDRFEAASAWDQLQRIAAGREQRTAQIAQFVGACRDRVDRQYDELCYFQR